MSSTENPILSALRENASQLERARAKVEKIQTERQELVITGLTAGLTGYEMAQAMGVTVAAGYALIARMERAIDRRLIQMSTNTVEDLKAAKVMIEAALVDNSETRIKAAKTVVVIITVNDGDRGEKLLTGLRKAYKANPSVTIHVVGEEGA